MTPDLILALWSCKLGFPSWILIAHPRAPGLTQSPEELSWPNPRPAENWRVWQSTSAVVSNSLGMLQTRMSPPSSVSALHTMLMPSALVYTHLFPLFPRLGCPTRDLLNLPHAASALLTISYFPCWGSFWSLGVFCQWNQLVSLRWISGSRS